MAGTVAISNNVEALKRIVAGLVAMAGLENGHSAVANRQSESAPAQAADSPTTPDCRLPTADCRLTLPRRLRLVILQLLRPAEAAARRLIIAFARGLVVALPPSPPRKPAPKLVPTEPILRGLGIAVVMSPADVARAAAARRAAALRAARPRTLSLPLLDPLRNPLRRHRRHVPAHAAPRIMFPGVIEPYSLPPPPSPDDPIDASRLALRLQALARALDDLSGHARRFARWQARAAAARRNGGRDAGRARRIWPLRSGRPPGGRLSRFDPCARRHSDIREVDEILAHAHALAVYALENPDTS